MNKRGEHGSNRQAGKEEGESAFQFHMSCADKQRREGPKTRLRTSSVMRYCRPSVALLVSSSVRATWAKAGNAYRSGQGASCREPPRIASCNLRPRAWGREDMRTSMQQPSSGANGIRGQMWTWTLENGGETRERGQAVGVWRRRVARTAHLSGSGRKKTGLLVSRCRKGDERLNVVPKQCTD